MQFRIDFLKPGKAVPSDNILFKLKKQLSKVQLKLGDRMISRVGTSITTLVISLSLLVAAIVFFYIAIYVPREKTLKGKADEIKRLQVTVNSMKKKRKEEKKQWDAIKTRINQLLVMRDKVVSWTDKLKAVNRNLVAGVWLENFEVKQKKAAAPAVTDKKRRGKKRGGEAKKPASVPARVLVSIKGATYAFAEDKPLKLVAEFMTNLMNDPVWEKEFDLADWVINTSEVSPGKDEELIENLKTVSFSMELERKQ